MNSPRTGNSPLAAALTEATEFFRAGDITAAIDILQPLVTAHRDFAPGWHLLGKVAEMMGDPSSAISFHERATALDATQPIYRAELCSAHVRAGQAAEGNREFQKLLAAAPQHAAALSPEVLVRLASVATTPSPTGLLDATALAQHRVRQLFQQVILLCARHRVERWWDCDGFHNLFAMQELRILRRALREFVLRRAGDARSFIRLSHELNEITGETDLEDHVLLQLAHGFVRDTDEIRATAMPQQDSHPPILLAVTLWTPTEIDDFLSSCLPSLLAPDNLPTLGVTRHIVLLVHIGNAYRELVATAPALRPLPQLGIELHIRPLDDSLLALVPQQDNLKDWYLDFLQRLQLEYARALGANLHVLMPHETAASIAARLRCDMHEANDAIAVQPSAPVFALQNGLLALHAAELHPVAEGSFDDLRRDARRVWESGAESICPQSDPDHMHNILRMLWHFDLLAEARDCLSRFRPQAPLAFALDDFHLHREEMALYAAAKRTATDDHAIYVVGMTIWGPRYIDFFCHFHLASLLAPGNLPALARRGKVVVSIATDAEGRQMIESSAIYRQLEAIADIHFSLIGSVPRRDSPEASRTFYMRYGLLDHLHIYFARSLGAHLMLMPVDTVISRHGLTALADAIADGAECATASCIEADRASAVAELAPLRQDDRIAIDPVPLTAIAVRHKTAYFKSLIVAEGNRLNAYPREFFWRVPGGYVCHAIFMHPVMLSARVMSRDFHPNHENVDWALLPRILARDDRIKVIDDNSRLFILHCSDADVRANEYSDFSGSIDGRFGEYLISVHLHDYPLHRRQIKQRQFFCVDDANQPVSRRYLVEASALQAMFDMVTPPVQ